MLFVTGDTHGDIERFTGRETKRLSVGDILFVCGDFGFIWDGNDAEKKNLKKLKKLKYTIAFVEGSHENFGRINSFPEEEWCGGKIHRIAPNIIHLARGQYYTVQGKTIFTMGGGASDDTSLSDTDDWWSSDLPNKAELIAGAANLELHESAVDIVITHEPSLKVKELLAVNSDNKIIRLNALNAFLEELAENVEYKKWYFGSLHIDKRITAKKRAIFSDIVEIHTDKDDIVL